MIYVEITQGMFKGWRGYLTINNDTKKPILKVYGIINGSVECKDLDITEEHRQIIKSERIS